MYLRAATVLMTALLVNGCATSPPETLGKTTRAEMDDSGVQHASILGGSYWFRPDRLVVRVGHPVVLSVRKTSTLVPHSFVIDAPVAGIEVETELGTKQKTVRFTPQQTGEYPFYCDETGLFGKTHREKGMEGVLEVIP